MASQKIKTEINCVNIAPLHSLSREVSSSSLKFAVFANNGSGKTFISRMFRLTESNDQLSLDEEGNSPTDKLITLGENTAKFSLKITDGVGAVTEDFQINLKNKTVPSVPKTNYLFHTFNDDYVEDNIRNLSFDKDSEIEGYILGKVNIDLSQDEDKLDKIQKEGTDLKTQVEKEITDHVIEKIDDIRDIKRLIEYSDLSPQKIINLVDKQSYNIAKSYDELLDDYNKIKSVPENLSDIATINTLSIDLTLLNKISEICKTEYSLSNLGENFKIKLKNKQSFIEAGVSFIENSDAESHCPFCEQELQQNAMELIDMYNKYLNDVEAKTITLLQKYRSEVSNYIVAIDDINTSNIKRINTFNTYKEKYIPSCSEIELKNLVYSNLKTGISELVAHIDEKIKDISKSIMIPDEAISSIDKYQTIFNGSLDSNNSEIKAINKKKNSIGKENLAIRKSICKRTVDDLIATHKSNIKNIEKLREDFKQLKSEIDKKKEQEKVSKKKKVASTIKSVLNYFFAGKYTLDEDTFRLTFNKSILEKKQANDILSAGEKNIVAFAYFIGDTHLKVENEEDYKKLFFIIDDPISSMDFSHVYTVCGVIRDLKKILDKITWERFILFTHNNDFMRILVSNNIVDKKLLLSNNTLTDFNNNLTVPYITHLMDIYKIARKEIVPNHTTANSIRHTLETLTKFDKIALNEESLSEYIRSNIPDETKAFTLINDLSHGGWRTEQAPITDEDYKDICETIVVHIEKKYKGQIDFCEKNC